MLQTSTLSAAGFEIRFQPLFRARPALTFPCNREGRVDLVAMSERVRNSYFFARATIGLEYSSPVVRPSDLHRTCLGGHGAGL